MAKYDELHNYLKARVGQHQIALTFREIERIIGSTLPASARKHRASWANTHTLVAPHAWLTAGFRVVDVDLLTEKVLFARDAPARTVPTGAPVAPRVRPSAPLPGTGAVSPRTRPASADGPERRITGRPAWEPLVVLALRRPLFHSEADFQFELAWTMREMGYRGIRLEKPFPGPTGKRTYLDIFAVEPGGRRLAIELKYWTRRFEEEVQGERFGLLAQGAQDISRYDFWKDVSRVEQLVASHEADAGYAVALTLDPSYLRPSSRTTIDEAFRLHEGREVHAGQALMWGVGASDGTTKGRQDEVLLRHDHAVRWARFSDNGPSWCLLLAVPTPEG